MPFGFCNVPAIKKVMRDYTTDFKELMAYELQNPKGPSGKDDEYQQLIQQIFLRHRSTMTDVAKGVIEFYRDLEDIFGEEIDLSEARNEVPKA